MEPPIGPGETWRLIVAGAPVGQGNVSAVPVMKRDPNTGRRYPVMGKGGFPVINVTHQNEKKLKPWRQEIAQLAVIEWGPRDEAMLDEACFVQMTFYVQRPEGHYKADGTLRNAAPLYPETTGDDIDKLARGVLDALTGIVFKNDKRVVTMPVRRRYGAPRVEIAVRRPHATTVADLRRLREHMPDLADELANQLQLELAVA